MAKKTNKRKIFNDPVHGFITIPNNLVFDLVEHPYFQRLRRISQTALTSFVYPGATHTRFHHALGCMHLMQKAIETLKQKKIKISKEEEKAALTAILLHDIGHGPFSHTLENSIAEGIHHETLSLLVMKRLNAEFNGKLELCLSLFEGKYPRSFFSELISSQLDIDRLDYLKRDCFYTGVLEGNINSDRIISMFNVSSDDRLVLDTKGVYSVEKFLLSRVFMYWQVYLHKTSTAVEIFLIQTLRRARQLIQSGVDLPASPSFLYFLKRQKGSLTESELDIYLQLDDIDIWSSLKPWQNADDPILSLLCKTILQRRLPKAEVREKPMGNEELEEIRNDIIKYVGEEGLDYFIHQNRLEVEPYSFKKQSIKLLNSDGTIIDFPESRHQVMGESLKTSQSKWHICYLDMKKSFYS